MKTLVVGFEAALKKMFLPDAKRKK